MSRSHRGWASGPLATLAENCQCASDIPKNAFCRNVCAQIARPAKEVGICICINNSYTGAGCPIIGEFCSDSSVDIHMPAITRHPEWQTNCKPGEILYKGECISFNTPLLPQGIKTKNVSYPGDRIPTSII